MSLSHAINAARSGLQVSGLRADIVATNVANAQTPGYVRRSVLLSETIVGTDTQGVRATGIGRASDQGLSAERMSLTSDLSRASVMASTWQTVSSRLGDGVDGNGLFGALSNFESALKAAEATPESKSTANSVIDAARALANEFNSLSSMVTNQRAEADREIADGVDVVNKALKDIEALNTQLSKMDRTSAPAAALMDERQRVLDTISEYMPVEAVDRNFGMIDVVTKEGVFLLSGTARQLEFTASSAFGPDDTLDGGQLSRLMVGDTELTPGSANWSAASSGLFGALFTLRDGDLPEFSAQLDTVAQDLIDRLSADGIDPTTLTGEFGLFADPGTPGEPGLAGRIQLNAAVDPAQGGEVWRLRDGMGATAEGPPGNGAVLSAMVNALTSMRSISENGVQGSFNASQLSAHLSSMASQKRVGNEAVLSSTSAQHTMAVEAEQSQTGVDVDAQMQELMLIEQAYAANARVIEVAGQMIQKLMEL